MTNHRINLFSLVHKGLRAELFSTAQVIARTDFGAAGEAERAVERTRRALGYLEEHAGHEDAVILPVLDRVAPVLGSDLRGAHVRLDGAAREIGRGLARVAAAPRSERLALGLRLHELFGRLVAEQILHMDREETEGSRALWAHCHDAQLMDMRTAIVSSIPTERYAEWLALMLPAMNEVERTGLLAALHAHMTGAEFHALLSPARAVLGEAAWHAAMVGKVRT